MLWDMYTYVFVCMLIFIITGLNMNAKTALFFVGIIYYKNHDEEGEEEA